MLQNRDRFEMLVGRRELAARYHGYLNKRIKERRVLYVLINVEADPNKPLGPSNQDQKIRLKIKSGQTAEWLADMVSGWTNQLLVGYWRVESVCLFVCL